MPPDETKIMNSRTSKRFDFVAGATLYKAAYMKPDFIEQQDQNEQHRRNHHAAVII